MNWIFIVLLIIDSVFLIKYKLNAYILAMWMTEKEYPLPNKQDSERLAKKVTDRWFRK